MVGKKGGDVRMCMDLRGLNKITETVKFPLPTPREMFDHLANSWWYSSMDCRSAYWSVRLREEDEPKTSFTVRNKKYCWKVMCFGLKNAPATFTHLMNKVLQGCQYEFALCFIDDILCYSGKDFNLHLQHVEEIFSRLKLANLKLKLPKCWFGADQTPFLGHIASREGLKPDPQKIEAIQRLRRPCSKKQVRSLLGLASYYRQFVSGFASIASPLYKLLRKDAPKGVEWTDDCEWAFQTLKDSLTSPPVLAFPDFEKHFVIETDASSTGLGAVLLQETDLGRQPIAYASRTCSAQEKNYSATEIECLGVIYALQQFRCYVLGTKFTLVTDHQALQNLKLMKNPSGRIARWLMALLEYDFNLVYRKGRLNTTADCLSRLPRFETEEELQLLEDENEVTPVVAAVTRSQAALMERDKQCQLLGRKRNESMMVSPNLCGDPTSGIEEIAKAQRNDNWCGPIMEYLSNGTMPARVISPESIAMSRYMSLCWGILWHHYDYQGENRRKGTRLQMVVPEVLRSQILHWAHEGAFGTHVGREKAFEALLDGYWWPNMARDVGQFIRTCETCQQFKDPAPILRQRIPILRKTMACQPFQVVCCDACTVRSRNIMIFICQFSGYVELQLMRGAVNGRSLSEAYLNCVVLRHSNPLTLVCDNVSYNVGGDFVQLLQRLGTKQTPVTAYHPQANGKAERCVASVKKLLKTLAHSNDNLDWEKLVPIAAFAFNTSYNRIIGNKPFFLVTGREPVLPGPVNMAITRLKLSVEPKDTSLYAINVEKRILKAFQCTTEKLKLVQDNYSHPGILEPSFALGDTVLLLNKIKGVDTLKPTWEGPYLITSVISPAVYQLKRDGKCFLAHASRLKKKF
jgi:hypothetical protein